MFVLKNKTNIRLVFHYFYERVVKLVFFLISGFFILLILGIVLIIKGFLVKGLILISASIVFGIIMIIYYERRRQNRGFDWCDCGDFGIIPDCDIPDCHQHMPDCHHHIPDCTPDCDCSPDCPS